MKSSRKALSLVLSFALLASTAVSTSAFAESTGTTAEGKSTQLTEYETSTDANHTTWSASFTWSSSTGIGNTQYTNNTTQPEGRYNYYTDGAYLKMTLKDKEGSAVPFSSVLSAMTMQTNPDDGNNAPIDDMTGNGKGRQYEDWTGARTAYYTNLNRTEGDDAIFYGVKQTGKTVDGKDNNANAGTVRTVGFTKGESRTVKMDLTAKEGSNLDGYTLTVEAFQQGNSSAASSTLTYDFTAHSIVAKIGDSEYESLGGAINYAKDGDTIQLQRDVTENVTIPKEMNVTIDLNGHNITNIDENTITNNGTLTIQGNGTVDNVTHAKAALYNNGTAVLKGGTYTRSKESGKNAEDSGGNSFYTVVNHGNMTISDGVAVKQAGHYSSLLENGWYNGNVNEDKTPSVLTINGGTFDGGLNTIKNDDWGHLTVYGGSFTNVSQAAFLNWNLAEIHGGIFDASEAGNGVILNGRIDGTMDQGQLIITGGTFTGKTILERMAISGSTGIGNVTITGGTFTSSTSIVSAVKRDVGTVSIYGGTFSQEPDAGDIRGAAVQNSNQGWTIEPGIEPVKGWEGPAGSTTKALTASEAQTFTFNFKTAEGYTSELQLDIYLGDNTGSKRDYNQAVQVNLPTSISGFTTEQINTLLKKISNETEKANTIQLLKAAGATFDKDEQCTNVTDLNSNITYKDSTWTITLNTKQLLGAEKADGRIEFLVEAIATKSSEDGTKSTCTWGNNNFNAQETLGTTQAYCYTITNAAPTKDSVTAAINNISTTSPDADAVADVVKKVNSLSGDDQKALSAKDVKTVETLEDAIQTANSNIRSLIMEPCKCQ